ncbi:hypothetical protein QZH41_005247 [Actinostola sp. cb2023]|nr:hypothetical protein QZH41_005247 [Actinostola sp. cb2023]
MADGKDFFERIKSDLSRIMQFLISKELIINAHNVDYFTTNLWETCLPQDIRDDLDKLTENEIASLPSLCVQWIDRADDLSIGTLQCCPNLLNLFTDIREHHLKSLRYVLKSEYIEGLNDERVLTSFMMNPKKAYEVEVMSQAVCDLVQKTKAKKVVDLGSGKGYLSQYLALRHDINVMVAEDTEYGFPVSDYLRRQNFSLSRNATMVAQQIPSQSIFYRAVLQVILKEKFGLNTTSRNHFSAKKPKKPFQYCRQTSGIDRGPPGKPGERGQRGKTGKLGPRVTFSTIGSGQNGNIQSHSTKTAGLYLVRAGGARGGTHSYNYGFRPGTYLGGRGATMQGRFRLSSGATLNIVVGQRGGNSVEAKGGKVTTKTAAQLGVSVEDNAGTGGGGGSFVYVSNDMLLLAAGGGGGASSGYHGGDGQAGMAGSSSNGTYSTRSRGGGSGGNPGQCNSVGGSYHGGVGAGWKVTGCARRTQSHGEPGGSRDQDWVGGKAGKMNSGFNGGPAPGAVGGYGGGGGGAEDNGASGGGGGYSGGGSGTHKQQAGGGGGSYCNGNNCQGVTGANFNDNGFVEITFLGP